MKKIAHFAALLPVYLLFFALSVGWGGVAYGQITVEFVGITGENDYTAAVYTEAEQIAILRAVTYWNDVIDTFADGTKFPSGYDSSWLQVKAQPIRFIKNDANDGANDGGAVGGWGDPGGTYSGYVNFEISTGNGNWDATTPSTQVRQGDMELVAVHELGHVMGRMSGTTPLVGAHSTVPYGNMNSSYSTMTRPFFVESELEVFRDNVGHDINISRFFGRSYEQSGITETISGAEFDLDGMYGIGIHLISGGNNIILATDITTRGYAGAGIRIEGVGNTVIIASGSTVTATGEKTVTITEALTGGSDQDVITSYGGQAVGVLISHAQNTTFVNRGEIVVTGENGRGVWIGDTRYHNGNDWVHNTATFDNSGVINASTDAVYISSVASNASAGNLTGTIATINLMQGTEITGNLKDNSVSATVSMSFGKQADANGRATNVSDSGTFTIPVAGSIDGRFTIETWGGTTIVTGDINARSLNVGQGTANSTFVIAGDATFSLTRTIAANGTLQIGNGGTTGSIEGTISNAGSLVFNRSDAVAFNSQTQMTGAGTITQAGTGTLYLSGNHTGDTYVKAGTLLVSTTMRNTDVYVNPAAGVKATLSGTGYLGAVTVSSGGILSPGSQLKADSLVLESGATLQFYVDTLTGSSLTRMVVADTLTISGGITVNLDAYGVGTYNLIDYGSLNDVSLLDAWAMSSAAPGDYTYTFDTTNYGLGLETIFLTIATADTPGPTGTNFYWKGGTGSSWDAVSNWADGRQNGITRVTTPGSGNDVFFSADSVSGSVATTLDGNVSVKSLSFLAGAGPVAIAPGTDGALTIGSGGISVADGAGAVTISAPITLAAAQTWRVGDDVSSAGDISPLAITDSLTVEGVISGSAGITKTGDGVLTLAAANTYNGNTLVNAGTLEITSAGSIPNGTVSVAASAAVNNAGSIGTVDVSGTLVNNNGGKITDAVLNSGSLTNSLGGEIATAALAGGVLDNSGAITAATFTGGAAHVNSGTIGTATLNGGTLTNSNRVDALTYTGGTYDGESGSIGSLIIAGAAAGGTNWGDVASLSFTDTGKVTVYASASEGVFTLTGIVAGEVDFDNASIVLNLSGLGEYTDALFEEFFNERYVTDFFGVDHEEVGDFSGAIHSLQISWDGILESVVSGSTPQGDWGVDGSTKLSYRGSGLEPNDASAVPEPATVVLLGLGLAWLGFLQARRRRSLVRR